MAPCNLELQRLLYFLFSIKSMVMNKKNLVELTGAGISAESGLKTFRDSDGLWEGYDVTEMATARIEEEPAIGAGVL